MPFYANDPWERNLSHVVAVRSKGKASAGRPYGDDISYDLKPICSFNGNRQIRSLEPDLRHGDNKCRARIIARDADTGDAGGPTSLRGVAGGGGGPTTPGTTTINGKRSRHWITLTAASRANSVHPGRTGFVLRPPQREAASSSGRTFQPTNWASGFTT